MRLPHAAFFASLAAALAFGFFSGILLSRHMTNLMGGRNCPRPEKMKEMYVRHLSHRLSLTEEQRARIEPMALRFAGSMTAVRTNSIAETRKSYMKLTAEIMPLLTEKQRGVYSNMFLFRELCRRDMH